jgi:hypothetical protein
MPAIAEEIHPPSAAIRFVGQLVGLFSFDLGEEIDLGRAGALISGATTTGAEQRRAAPAYVGHRTPPLRAALGTREVPLGADMVPARASVVVHEVGAVTIQLAMPLDCDVTTLPTLTATLTGAGPLEDAARALLDEIRPRLSSAVTGATAFDIVEDYYVVQVDHLLPQLSIEELLRRARRPLASALRCEPGPLSDTEVEEAFRTRLSYYPDDLIVTDWNVAIVIDPEHAAALEVLEYLNVQLLELRYFDALLDRQIGDTYGVAAMRAHRFPLMNRPYRRVLDELGAIRLDVASMVERLHNAFKLGGDLYLTKLYTRTAVRLGLATWEANVQRKLELLHQRYNVLAERANVARSEVLELTIVVLIVIELVLLLFGRG